MIKQRRVLLVNPFNYDCQPEPKKTGRPSQRHNIRPQSTYESFMLVTGHFVPRSFRTQVISYRFGHFVPTFIFNLVISYPVWSFRTHFVSSLVISYLLLQFSRKPFWSFRTYFLLFRTQVISYPKSFRTHFSHFVPRSFRTHFQTRHELTWVRNDFLFCCNLLLPD